MKTAIIDDTTLYRAETRSCFIRYIQDTCARETPIVEGFSSGKEFLSRFIPGDYDIIFIDQYMDGLSKMDTTREVRSRDELAALVFVTTSREHAIGNYGIRTCDYLMKPLNCEDFRQTMELVRPDKIRGARPIRLEQSRFLLREILWRSQSSHYVMIHTDKRGVLEFRISFGELMEILSSYPQLLICYKCCTVNIGQAKRTDGLDFVLGNGEWVPSSGRDRKRIMALSDDYLLQQEREEEVL